MSDLERLRQEAARILGPEAASELEKEIETQVKSDGKVRIAGLVAVDQVRFTPDAVPRAIRSEILPAPSVYVDHARMPGTTSASERLIGEAIKGEYRYSMLGLVLGMSTILGGVVLGLHGVVGSTSWTARVLGLESRINDAAPGVVLFIVGIFYIWMTRPKVRLRDLQG